MTKKDDQDKPRIHNPGELDVLCGRGGMSNHHPGNEWYRRLIRSNRPLYRACPKHTKLLVSKAIVQAVQEQGGRFLEKNVTYDCWIECSYKKAVDKTSQGLRERERDDDHTPSVGSNDSGDLQDFVHVTPPTIFKPSPPMEQKPGDDLPIVLQAETLFSEQPSDCKPSHKIVAFPTVVNNQQTTKHSNPEEDMAPWPPTLQQQETSMVRWLKQTNLLLHKNDPCTNIVEDTPTLNLNNAFTMCGTDTRKPDEPLLTQFQPPHLQTHAALQYSNFPFHKNSKNTAVPPPPTLEPGTTDLITTPFPSPPPPDNAPALTRLTSQMSDWLKSFWPVTTLPSQHNFRPTTVTFAHNMDQPLGNSNQPQQETTSPSNTLLLDHSEENPYLSYPHPGQNVRTKRKFLDESGPRKRAKRKSSPEISPVDTPAEDLEELERSISATLLKLAQSPSKLLGGLSCIFGLPSDEPVPPHFGMKRACGSLLEDPEETLILEQKMRVGQWNGSLRLDD